MKYRGKDFKKYLRVKPRGMDGKAFGKEPLSISKFTGGTDTEEKFLASPIEHQGYWKQQAPVEYGINNYGFRSDNFQGEECRDSITFIGCSNTFGIGLPKEYTWAYKVAKHFELKEINLGIPGGSLDACFRVYNEWQPIHKSKITCLLIPPGARTELLVNKSWEYITSTLSNPKLTWLTDEMIVALLDPLLMDVNRERNIAAITHIANQTDSKLIILPYVVEDKIDLARDLSHGGKKTNDGTAQKFIDKIEEN